VAKRCFNCNGTGEMCDCCGEAENVCQCDKDRDGGSPQTFSPCPDCNGTGAAAAAPPPPAEGEG
jgi:hypothetical protein